MVKPTNEWKHTNPKDAVGIKKPRYYSAIPMNVVREVGIAFLEGGMKYGRHNFRVAGVRADVYYDACIGHLADWWEGQDIDPDSGLHHITKAIACLFVIRDAQLNGLDNDNRPPHTNVDKSKEAMQKIVDSLFEKYPEPEPPYIKGDTKLR